VPLIKYLSGRENNGVYERHNELFELEYRENVADAAYGPYWCLVNTSSNTAAAVSNTARIEQSVRTPSPVTVPKGGAIRRLEGIVNLEISVYV
jgi:hypothetical protein